MFHLYGLLIGIGILVGFWVSQKQARVFRIDPSLIEDALLWMFFPAIIGARLYELLTNWSQYSGLPFLALFAVWQGGLGVFGAITGGIVGLAVFSKLRPVARGTASPAGRLSTFFLLLDLFSFGVPMGQAIGRLGNWVNQEVYGLPTSFPWGIQINGVKYHPLFAYEALLSLCLFFFLNWLGWRKKLVLGKGQYASLYLFCYGWIRFMLDFVRFENIRPSGLFSVFTWAQWVAVGCMIGGLVLFWIRRHAPKKEFDWSLS